MGAAVAAEMHHANAALAQHPAHQQPPMALGGILFAAENRGPALRCNGQQAFYPLAETGRLGHFAVEDATLIVVEALVVDPSAQQVAEEHILNRPLDKRGVEHFPVELRSVA